MNSLPRASIKCLLLTIFTIGQAANTSSGFHFGGQIAYLNSSVESSITDSIEIQGNTTLLTTTVEKRYYSVTGFAPGVVAGYKFLKDNLYFDASLTLLTSNAEHTEEDKTDNVGRTFTLKANHLIYPFVTAGYLVNSDTMIGLKAGYGRENWHVDYSPQDQNLSTKADFDSNGWLIGAEILTVIRDNMSIGLNATYSRIDKFTAQTNTTNQTCALCLAPETTNISAALVYSPASK